MHGLINLLLIRLVILILLIRQALYKVAVVKCTFYFRPHKIESMFWFQNSSDLYARVRKQNTDREKNTGIINHLNDLYNLVILVKWNTLWKWNVLKLGKKAIPRLFMCKQFSWSFNFHQNSMFTVKYAQISMDLEKMFVCVFPEILSSCMRERNQNILLSGLNMTYEYFLKETHKHFTWEHKPRKQVHTNHQAAFLIWCQIEQVHVMTRDIPHLDCPQRNL